MTPKFHKLTVKTVSKLIKDAVSIEFNVPKELESSFQYLPGQYLTLKTHIQNETSPLFMRNKNYMRTT